MENGKDKIKNLKVEKILDHLEYFGYEIYKEEDEDAETYRVFHQEKPDFYLRNYNEVIVIYYFLPVKEKVIKQKNIIEKLLNKLNEGSKFLVAGIAHDDSVFFFAYYFGVYGKTEFGRFIELINDDYVTTIQSVGDWEKYLDFIEE
ncbi:MAG: hypothetical protein ISR82_06255 [Candidatus Marinimicrobia bacterium]|nr:hypothetical protein [Candidatus Neomarinimicrobiota bacterium]MBL7010806.1 hypothetical protein [Candidatus Neomarinimicrobiota bacterium]MBL7031010.1 hypothetical protein [Candidatus Neomarinimicrobiota bacterium]